jgi:hypothetical protein
MPRLLRGRWFVFCGIRLRDGRLIGNRADRANRRQVAQSALMTAETEQDSHSPADVAVFFEGGSGWQPILVQ